MIRQSSLVFAVLAGAAYLVGCGDAIENHATDNTFLRVPGTKTEEVAVKNSFLPLAAGSHWTMTLRRGEKTASEETIALGTRTQWGVTGNVIEYRTDGKLVRQEMYHEDKTGLFFVATGRDKEYMVMKPPVPLVNFPLSEGKSLTWNGNLQFAKATSAASAASRVSARESTKTAAGTFDSYRVDTIISVTENGKTVSYPTRRWISPGVGVVKQKMMMGKDLVWKELKNYRVAGAEK